MKPSLPFVAFLSICAGACTAAQPAVAPVADRAPAEKAAAPKRVEAPAKEAAIAPGPTLGDYTVYRFSGSFRAKPLWLKERLVDREGEISTFELTVDEAGDTRVLRVVKVGGDAFSVTRIDGSRAEELDVASYDTLMEGTAYAADTNEGLIDSEPTTLLVGGREIAGTKTRFKVTVNGKEGILAVVTSDEMPGRDLSGDLTLGDGTVVYRASLVESGNEVPTSSFASRF